MFSEYEVKVFEKISSLESKIQDLKHVLDSNIKRQKQVLVPLSYILRFSISANRESAKLAKNALVSAKNANTIANAVSLLANIENAAQASSEAAQLSIESAADASASSAFIAHSAIHLIEGITRKAILESAETTMQAILFALNAFKFSNLAASTLKSARYFQNKK